MALALYSDTFWFPSGQLAAGVVSRIFLHTTNTLAPLWQDAGGTIPAANPAFTDANGLLTFWIEEGTYWLHLDTESFEITVPAGGGGSFLPLAGGTLTGPLEMTGGGVDIDVQQAVSTAVSTGVISGGLFTVNAGNPGAVDISAMVGYVVDYATDPLNPVVQRVSTPAQTVVMTDVVNTVTYWLMDAAGTVIQQATQPTNVQRRTHLQLAASAQFGGSIFEIVATQVALPQQANQFADLTQALGAFPVSGNTISANGANLSVNTTGGTLFIRGRSQGTAPDDPHIVSTSAASPAQYRRGLQSTINFGVPVSVIDPANYDNAGVLTAVGGGANSSTIQRVYAFAAASQPDQMVILYGQKVYGSLTAAVAGAAGEAFTVNPQIAANGTLIALIAVTRTATNLSDVTQAQFIQVGKFGGGASAGAISALSALPPWVFDISDAAYGAVGDAVVLTDGAMTAGSAVLTSATGGFTSTGVGKAISVKGAAAAGITTLVTTILSFQSTNQVTLNAVNSSGGNVTGALVIRGTNNQTAIQAATNAAEAYLAAGNTYAQVYIPPLPYVVAGALNNTKSGNGQIVFGPQATTAVKKILEFRGETDGAAAVRHWQQTVPQFAGSCLISLGVYASTAAQIANINADGNPGVISGPNEGFGYGVGAVYSNTQAVLKNLAILTTHSSFGLTYGAFNLFGCANAHVENVGYGTAGTVAAPSTDYSSPGTFGTGLSIGALMPAPGNNDYTIAENVSCGGGYTYAFFLTEHGLMSRYMALYCWAGLCAVGTYFGSVGSVHAMKVLSASIEACTHELYIIGAGSSGVGPIIDIDQLSTESSTPNIDGNSAAAMAAALGRVKLTGLFTETGVSVSNPTGIELVNGQVPKAIKRKTAAFTCSPIDRILICDTDAIGAFTATLPTVGAAFNPVTYVFHNIGANVLTVATGSAQTITAGALPGATSVAVASGAILRLSALFDGSAWGWFAV